MRILCTYKTTDKPWGGANNFIRSVYDYLVKHGHADIVFDGFEKNLSLVFFNQISRGPGRGIFGLGELIKLIRIAKKESIPIVTRFVNLNSHAHNKGLRYFMYGFIDDLKTYYLVRNSRLTVFQSEYQKGFFEKSTPFFWKNSTSRNSVVIHNGADNYYELNSELDHHKSLNELILVSNTFSPRSTKKHQIIKEIADLEGVRVHHVGNWPNDLPSGKVILEGLKTKEQIAALYKNAHYLLHPAIKDPCPNVLFEAISLGLPVIYNSDEGSSQEIVRGNGFAFNNVDRDKLVHYALESWEAFSNKVAIDRSYYGIERSAKQYLNQVKKLVE